MKKLYLLCGCSGSGKSTWIQNRLIAEGGSWVSRDLIRLSMVAATEPYFSKETEVFKEFITTINERLQDDRYCGNVFADATHLSPRARKDVLRRLNLVGVQVIAVDFDIPLTTLIERNANRTGRANVPTTVIRDMHGRFIHPSYYEKHINKIIVVNEKGEEKVLDNPFFL